MHCRGLLCWYQVDVEARHVMCMPHFFLGSFLAGALGLAEAAGLGAALG